MSPELIIRRELFRSVAQLLYLRCPELIPAYYELEFDRKADEWLSTMTDTDFWVEGEEALYDWLDQVVYITLKNSPPRFTTGYRPLASRLHLLTYDHNPNSWWPVIQHADI